MYVKPFQRPSPNVWRTCGFVSNLHLAFPMTWQAVGWIIGFVMGDFTYTLVGWASGVVLSIIVSAGCANVGRPSPFLRVCCFFVP